MRPNKLSPAVLALCASAAALAQSGPTVYGTVDAGVLAVSNVSGSPAGYLPSAVNAGSVVKLADGGIGQSNFGFKGREDLGGGLGALYQLQGNINSGNGNVGGPNSSSGTSFFNQIAMVGLSGSLGQLTAGRVVSPMYFAMASTDVRQGRYFGSSLTALVGVNSASNAFIGNNSNPSFGTVYNDNALVYTSPKWNGLTANLEYALGGVAGSNTANAQQAATLQYDANGLKLSALYYAGYGNNLPAATTLYTAATGSATTAAALLTKAGLTQTAKTNQLTSVGALYAWDKFSVSASYFQARNPANVVLKGGSGSLNMWSLGAGWKLLPTLNLTSGYYHITDNTNAGNNASQFALGLDYLLSKRTTLYAEFGSVTNHGANMNMSPMYGNPVAANAGVHAEMIGMRHSF